MKERGDNMRILVISDSHGQLGNLNEILKEAGKVDRVIHLGDAVGQDEEIREMCGCPVTIVRGNCDFYSKNELVEIVLSGCIASQHIKKTMRQLRNENCHTRFYIRKIKAEIHFVLLAVKCSEIIFNLFLGNQQVFQFPFNTHEEDVLYMIYILIQIDNISFVYRNKVCHFCKDSRFVGTVQ